MTGLYESSNRVRNSTLDFVETDVGWIELKISIYALCSLIYYKNKDTTIKYYVIMFQCGIEKTPLPLIHMLYAYVVCYTNALKLYDSGFLTLFSIVVNYLNLQGTSRPGRKSNHNLLQRKGRLIATR